MKTVGMVMAAGQSRRFGSGNKLLAMLDGKSVIARTVETLCSLPLSHLIAIVVDDDVASQIAGCQIVHVSKTGNTMSRNISLGIDAAVAQNADRILIALGDMPFVSSKHYEAVIASCTPDTPSASYNGRSRMPPACFGRIFFEQLKTASGDHGAAKIIAQLPEKSLVHASGGLLRDIDFVTDLKAGVYDPLNG